MRCQEVKINGISIGDNYNVFIVAELGVCHEQHVELAEHFIEVASDAGIQAVKVESFQADELVLDKTITHTYGTINGEITENYYNLLKRLELTYDDIKKLKFKADKCDILFFSTVHNKKNVDVIDEIGVCAFKIASPDIINFPLLRYVATKKKPIFLDTGGAYIYEIEQAILTLEKMGIKDIIIMHNPSGYPAPPEKTDLRMISVLKKIFEYPVGLSCHTPGFDMVMAAIALGANVIEKPISRSKEIKNPEHIFSFLDVEAKDFVKRIRNLEKALGGKRRKDIDEKTLPRFIGRRGIYAKYDIKKGEKIDMDMILLAKPQKGIPVQFIDNIIGRRAKNDIKKHNPITWDDI